MPTKPRPARRGRTRLRRGRKLASLDYHRFKLRQVLNLTTTASAQSLLHINMYNLTQFASQDNDTTFVELEEKTTVKNLFDSYRMESITVKYYPFANVAPPDSLPPIGGGANVMPPLYIVMDTDQVGLIPNTKVEFITRKNFKIRDSTKPFTVKYKVPWQYNANAGKNGWINLQDENNNFEGGIYIAQPDTQAGIPPLTQFGTLLIEAIIEMKDRQ